MIDMKKNRAEHEMRSIERAIGGLDTLGTGLDDLGQFQPRERYRDTEHKNPDCRIDFGDAAK
jgi:hypothetical protein